MTRVVRIIVLIFLFAQTANAQYEDFETWINFTLKGELSKKVSYTIEPEIRLFENASQLSTWQTEFNLGYEALKRLDIGGIYRFAVNFEKPNYNRRIHRFAAYLKYEVKTNRLRWRYRAQLQNEYVNWNSSEKGTINYLGHRHKLSVKYQKKKWKVNPSAGIEYYFSISPYEERGDWKYRYYFTLEGELNKRLNAKLSYKRQDEFDVIKPDLVNILFVGFEYKPKFLKMRKKKTKK